MVVIRPWSKHDGREPARIVRAVFDEYGFTWDEGEYCADLYDVQLHYIEQGHYFWIAELDEKPVGTVALERFPRIPEVVVGIGDKRRIGGASCSLERLYLLQEARGKGIGALLFEATIKKAHALGCQRMEIWSDKKFAEAHRLYMKYGAEVIAERVCDDPDQSPEHGLRLEIGEAMNRIRAKDSVE
jgi:putative acetyltransferase